jgi:Carboxypeptidase regulatory-like domain
MSRRSVTIHTMAVLIAWAVHGRADEKPARAPAQTGAITGMVVDPHGRPVAGATIWGASRQEKLESTRSGADGRFRMAGLKPDKPVTVWADAPNLARERRDDVHIFPGKDRDIGRLTLLPGTRSRGHPRLRLGELYEDRQGRPVHRARRRKGPQESPAPVKRLFQP